MYGISSYIFLAIKSTISKYDKYEYEDYFRELILI